MGSLRRMGTAGSPWLSKDPHRLEVVSGDRTVPRDSWAHDLGLAPSVLIFQQGIPGRSVDNFSREGVLGFLQAPASLTADTCYTCVRPHAGIWQLNVSALLIGNYSKRAIALHIKKVHFQNQKTRATSQKHNAASTLETLDRIRVIDLHL